MSDGINELVYDPRSDNTLVDQRSDLRDPSNYGHTDTWVEGTSDGGHAGGTTWDNVMGIKNAIAADDWVGIGVGVVGLSVDVGGFWGDPIGTCAAQIAGVFLEHLHPLRAWLHLLSGNPEMVKGYAGTWERIRDEMYAIGTEYRQAVFDETHLWWGAAGDAYRVEAGLLGDFCASVGAVADCMALAALKIAEVVNTFRTMVRDTLANLAAVLVNLSIKAAFGGPVGWSVGIAQGTARIARAADKIGAYITMLMRVLDKFGAYVGALKNLVDLESKMAQARTAGGK